VTRWRGPPNVPPLSSRPHQQNGRHQWRRASPWYCHRGREADGAGHDEVRRCFNGLLGSLFRRCWLGANGDQVTLSDCSNVSVRRLRALTFAGREHELDFKTIRWMQVDDGAEVTTTQAMLVVGPSPQLAPADHVHLSTLLSGSGFRAWPAARGWPRRRRVDLHSTWWSWSRVPCSGPAKSQALVSLRYTDVRAVGRGVYDLVAVRPAQSNHAWRGCPTSLKQSGRTSSWPAPSCLSPAVKYHGLARRHWCLRFADCGRCLTAVRWRASPACQCRPRIVSSQSSSTSWRVSRRSVARRRSLSGERTQLGGFCGDWLSADCCLLPLSTWCRQWPASRLLAFLPLLSTLALVWVSLECRQHDLQVVVQQCSTKTIWGCRRVGHLTRSRGCRTRRSSLAGAFYPPFARVCGARYATKPIVFKFDNSLPLIEESANVVQISHWILYNSRASSLNTGWVIKY